MLVVASLPTPDVGSVVGSRSGRDGTMFKEPLFNRKLFAGAGAHQHDVHQALSDDLPNRFAKLFQAPVMAAGARMLRRRPWSRDAKSHVGIFRVRQNEVPAGRISGNPRQFLVECLKHVCVSVRVGGMLPSFLSGVSLVIHQYTDQAGVPVVWPALGNRAGFTLAEEELPLGGWSTDPSQLNIEFSRIFTPFGSYP